MEKHYSELPGGGLVEVSDAEARTRTVQFLTRGPSEMSRIGESLTNGAYHVIPLPPLGHSPAVYQNGLWTDMSNWIEFAYYQPWPDLIQEWGQFPGCGAGIVTGGTTGLVAVSINREECCDRSEARSIIEDHLGKSPLIRDWGRKLLLLYHTEETFNGFKLGPLEVLATGQCFRPYGIDPDTMSIYDWPEKQPLVYCAGIAPKVTEAQLQAALQAAFDWDQKEAKRRGMPQPVSSSPPAVREGKALIKLAAPSIIRPPKLVRAKQVGSMGDGSNPLSDLPHGTPVYQYEPLRTAVEN